MLTTHAAFRAPHLEYAVEKGVNVFMEKDFAADPGGIKRILRAGEAAEKKNLKIAAGLMCRHSSARQALIQKIRDGAMGDIQLIRAYRMDPGYFMGPFPRGENELLWQLSPGHPYQFLWSSGGIFIELMIHQIDECFWIKDSWPVSAHGVGGRFAGSTDCSQNLDSYSIEYTFADGTKALVTGRYIPELPQRFRHVRPRHEVRREVLRQHPRPDVLALQGPAHRAVATSPGEPPKETVNPWQAEWDVLLERHPQRPAAQRSPARGPLEPRRHHGPGGRALGQDHHLGRGDGLELPVLPQRGRADRRQPRARAGRRPRPLPGAHPGQDGGDLAHWMGAAGRVAAQPFVHGVAETLNSQTTAVTPRAGQSKPASASPSMLLVPADCHLQQFAGALEVELLLDAGAVGIHRLHVNAQLLGDLARGQSAPRHLEHLQLAVGQHIRDRIARRLRLGGQARRARWTPSSR